MPILLLVFSSDFFYQAFSAPLKWITPVSEKKKLRLLLSHQQVCILRGPRLILQRSGLMQQVSSIWKNWAPEILVAGGVMEPYDPPLDIKGIRLILRGMGIPDDAILVETKSKNTHENGYAISEILAEKIYNVFWLFHTITTYFALSPF